MTLYEDRCHFGVEADGKKHRGQLEGVSPDHTGRICDGQGVKVDDAVVDVGPMLILDPSAQGTQVIAQMYRSGWLYARKDARHVARLSGTVSARTDFWGLPCRDGHTSSLSGVSYEVQTPVFEGPFDLLLHLILREEVDIHEITLSTIVDGYLRELTKMQQLDLEIATEFLLIAATLVELKARRLLPGKDGVDLDDELALWEERDLLLARLLECKTFKDVSRVLARFVDDADRVYARTAGPDERFADVMPDLLEGVTIKKLERAMVNAITPKPQPNISLYHVSPVRFTVAETCERLVDALPTMGRTSFRQLTREYVERLEIIVHFLALLELYKQGYIEIEQADRFGDLEVLWTGVGPTAGDGFVMTDDYEG